MSDLNTEDYRPSEDEPYMNDQQQEYFRRKLMRWREEILRGSSETLRQLKEEDNRLADMSDWASFETERSFQLRARDRERKLLSKIAAAIERIDDGSYGYCEETQEPIGLQRLEARPTATLSFEAQVRSERREIVFKEGVAGSGPRNSINTSRRGSGVQNTRKRPDLSVVADVTHSDLGGGESEGATFQTLSAIIYVKDGSREDAEELFSSTETLLNELGYDLEAAEKWRRGSWWRRAFFKLSNLSKSKKVLDRAQVIENVLYGKGSLDIATGISKATVDLIQSLRDHKGTIAIDVGLFLFLKKSGPNGEADIFAKRLTVDERAFLDSDPSRVCRPNELFDEVENMTKVTVPNSKDDGPDMEEARQVAQQQPYL